MGQKLFHHSHRQDGIVSFEYSLGRGGVGHERHSSTVGCAASAHAEAGCAVRYSLLGNFFLDGIMNGELGEKEKSMERPIIMI